MIGKLVQVISKIATTKNHSDNMAEDIASSLFNKTS